MYCDVVQMTPWGRTGFDREDDRTGSEPGSDEVPGKNSTSSSIANDNGYQEAMAA